MNMEMLVKDYIAAWNRLDAASVAELMHDGAAYYDAFWMETCVGKHLPRYIQDSMDEESLWYEQVGKVILVENGVTYRYSAHERTDSTIGPPLYFGAAVLLLRDNKILTVSDYYCNPDPAALEEIAVLATRRHGVPSHTNAGLSALKTLHVRSRLVATVAEAESHLDPTITISKFAENIGCSVDHLSQILDREFGSDFDAFMCSHRVEYARSVLDDGTDDPGFVMRVAAEAGFRSAKELSEAFSETFGTTLAEFLKSKKTAKGSVGKSPLH